MGSLEVLPDGAALAEAAANHFVALARVAVRVRGLFRVALSGGSTPRGAYQCLASEAFASQVDWQRVHVFWGDERCVPPDHPDSNFRMAKEALLDHVPLASEHVHRVRGELDPKLAAADYEETLRGAFYPDLSASGANDIPVPRFDLILLGMGDDGHTASLFPGTAALHEARRWVVANHVAKLDSWRITLTPVVVNAAAQLVFLVSGAGKSERLREVRGGPYRPDALPAQLVEPTDGDLLWLVDQAAASLL